MKKLLLILLCLPMIGFGQNVNIPDANFKAYLIGNSLINTNGDTEIQLSEANAFNGTINCNSLNISNLTGIEAFTDITELDCGSNQTTNHNQITNLDLSQNLALTSLNCYYTQLISLNVSQNTALEYLICKDNQLTSLDLSNNLALTELDCGYNQLTNLDLSNNLALTELICTSNQLTNLDLSQNTALKKLNCGGNQLESLDLRNGNNTMIINLKFGCLNNPNLYCINVDDSTYSANTWTFIDPQHYFSTNCSQLSTIKEHIGKKELLKITDLFGREIKQTNQPLFYIYNDGTVEKRIVIE